MNISDDGRAFVTRQEGCRNKVYLDSAGKPTVGIGHLVLPRDKLRVGDAISDDRIQSLFDDDLTAAESALDDLELEQPQFDALVDFVFNLGSEAFRGSTLRRYLLVGNCAVAADQLLRWDKERVDGVVRVNPGLTRRRREERLLFLEGVYG